MDCFFISYDLCKPKQDYEKLIDKIKSFSKIVRVNKSCYLVQTTKQSVDIRDMLRPYIDSNDRLFVAKLTGQAAWSNCIDNNDHIKDCLT